MKGRNMKKDAVWNDLEFARVLIADERREMEQAQRRERTVCLGAVLILGTALVAVCWGLWL